MPSQNTFCILPFIHIEARTDGRLAPCCVSKNTLKRNDANDFHLAQDRLQDAYDSAEMQTLRNHLLSGVRDANCSACWNEEDSGRTSKRTDENRRFAAHAERVLSDGKPLPFPIFLDLKLGNKCNLKCRICGPDNSSKWMEESLKFSGKDYLQRCTEHLRSLPEAESRYKISHWPEVSDHFWQEFAALASTLERIDFFGGEPTLIERHYEILQFLADKGYAQNIRLQYSTNGTFFPEKAVTEIYHKFKSVTFGMSIDGLHERFEYQRFPASFENVRRTYELYVQHGFLPNVGMTVSAFTIFHITEDLHYWISAGARLHLNMLYMPPEFDISLLPPAAKKICAEKIDRFLEQTQEPAYILQQLKAVKNYMLREAGDGSARHLLKTIREIDGRRNQNFAAIFPEWHSILTGL